MVLCGGSDLLKKGCAGRNHSGIQVEEKGPLLSDGACTILHILTIGVYVCLSFALVFLRKLFPVAQVYHSTLS